VGPEDAHAEVYSFLAGGVQALPPYTIYENLDALPRVFLVHKSAPIAERSQVLAQLKATDFRREVLLEEAAEELESTPSSPAERTCSARVLEYLPNRVEVQVRDAIPGYLVLTDVFFPGWKCTVDGQPARIHRANFLFRAVAIPAGTHEIVFEFQPASYRWGKSVSGVAVLAVVGISLFSRCRKKELG
jgi:uncharacterized membrane protein YfhO